MTLALHAAAMLSTPLLRLSNWLDRVTGFTATAAPIHRAGTRASRPLSVASEPARVRSSTPPSLRRTARPTLRIERIVESGQGANQAGRMVMSGRMADVCAELDRLVAREAALH